MTEAPKRKYGMSDAALSQFAINAVGFLTSDVADLAKFGVTAAKITELSDLQEQFEVFATDLQKVAQVMQAVVAKNNKRTEIERAAADIRVRAQIAFAAQPEYLQEFGFEGLGAKADNTVSQYGFSIHAASVKYAAELGEFGQTAAETTAFATLVNEFQALVQAVAAAQRDRATTTIARINLGNALYAKVVEHCAFGRACYAHSNAAKYQSYLIYADADVSQTPPAAPVIEVIDGTAEAIFDEDVTSMVMLKRTDPNAAFEEIHDGPNVPVAVGEGYGYLEIKAFGRNAAGNGEIGAKIIYGITPPPTNVEFDTDRLEWETDASIESVEIEASYDGGATFNEIATVVDANEYVWTPPSGPIVFRVRSKRGGEYSTWVVYSTVIP